MAFFPLSLIHVFLHNKGTILLLGGIINYLIFPLYFFHLVHFALSFSYLKAAMVT